ncbi:hypothetical protein CDV36_016300 [Fusarium kuroshium]|uniref:Uncharacterized protein n=2 Tax=Fusarium solani species complex TaxID=232080 RepID=A0A3M2QUG5_9HYPO|nr:hypothetical protein CDV36_016300 [Fusarium kuroshium]RSL42099.1 hypothetical protein CEP51_016514 [Fusarium floridanum]
MKYEDAVLEHHDLGAALDINDERLLKSGSKSEKLKKLVAQFLIDAMRIDREQGIIMVDSYRTKWLAIMEHPNTKEILDLDEYLAFRRENGGMDPFWAMARFGMDMKLDDAELSSVAHIFNSVDNALVLTNDYYSWGRENAASQRVGSGRIVNSIELMMRTKEASDDSTAGSVSTRKPISLGIESSSDSSTSFEDIVSESKGTKLQQFSPTGDIDAISSSPITHPETIQLWFKPDSSVIQEPCEYMRLMPSKGVRKSLIDALNDWLRVPKFSINTIEEIIRLLHDASLILDDIEDNSPLRRGKPAVHMLFGHSQAINSANFMSVQAVRASRKLLNQGGVDVLLEDLECLYLGQSLDLYWKFSLKCPTENEYINMIDNKTGGMFRMLIRLMRAESPRFVDISFDRLVLLFGRFFQIRDDYMNLASGQYADSKGFCEDLDEGKFSYPIVYCVEHSPRFKSQILGIFRQRPTALGDRTEPLSREVKMHILSCLEVSGALDATLEYANRLEDELELEIDKLEAVTNETNPMLRLLLARLSMKGGRGEA